MRTASHPLSLLRRYRWRELSLLLIPTTILLLAMTQLLLVNGDPDSSLNINNLPVREGLIPLLGFVLALLVTHVMFTIFFPKADQILFPLVGLMSGLGILMSTRLGPDIPQKITNLGSRQLLWALLGMVVCLGTMFALRNLRWLSRYKYTWALLAIGVLIPSVVKGILTFRSADSTPTRDALELGFLGLQPSEFSKIALVIFFAAYLSDNRDLLTRGFFRVGFLRLPPFKQLGPLLLMLGVALMVFLVVRDLGLALLIYTLFLCMTYLASNKLGYVVVNLVLFIGMAYIGYILLDYVQKRFLVVSSDILTPWTEDKEALYQKVGGSGQIVQGLIALASGGILGTGLGLGHPAGRGYVPEVQSDMVLTAIGEELGLAGILGLICLYLLIIHRGFHIAMNAPDPFVKLLAAGLTSIFAIQTLVISAGNLKLIPLTGIPLPYLSNGGSSLIANFMIVGILMRISHNTRMELEGPY